MILIYVTLNSIIFHETSMNCKRRTKNQTDYTFYNKTRKLMSFKICSKFQSRHFFFNVGSTSSRKLMRKILLILFNYRLGIVILFCKKKKKETVIIIKLSSIIKKKKNVP